MAVEVDNRLDRSISMRFTNYSKQPEASRYSVDHQDREIHQEEEEFVGLFMQGNPIQLHHVPYNVCFCDTCNEEAQKVNEEPFNTNRSGKPRRRIRRPGRVWETKEGNWDTLGMYSGKYDYYVRYDTPIPTSPLTEIIATGWDDDDSSNEECSPGRVIVNIIDSSDSESDSAPVHPEPSSFRQQYPEERQEAGLRRPIYYKRGLFWHRDDSSTSYESDADEVTTTDAGEGVSEHAPEWLNPFSTPPEIICSFQYFPILLFLFVKF